MEFVKEKNLDDFVTSNRIQNYTVSQKEEKNDIFKDTIKVSAVALCLAIATHSVPMSGSSVYTKDSIRKKDFTNAHAEDKKDKEIRSSFNKYVNLLINEEGMKIMDNEDVRQKDLDNLKETVYLKIDNTNMGVSDIQDTLKEIKETLKGLPSKDYVDSKVKEYTIGMMVALGTVGLAICGFIAWYLPNFISNLQ